MEALKIQNETQAGPTSLPDQPPGPSAQRPEAHYSQQPQVAEQVPEEFSLEDAAADLAQRFKVNVVVAYDEKTGQSVVRIMSSDGERLLRQMPPEEVRQMAAAARRGALINLLDSLV